MTNANKISSPRAHRSARCHNCSSQDQRSRSNIPTVIRLVEPNNIHYRLKSQQNLTSSFKFIAKVRKQLSRSKVKVT